MPLEPAAAVKELHALLEPLGDAERAEGAQRYLKSTRPFLGVTVPDTREVAKRFWRAHPGLTPPELRALAEALYATGTYEHRAVAVALIELGRKSLTEADLPWMIALIRRSETWALVDWLAANVIGELVAREPALAKHTDAWARDKDFWVRRTALLAHLQGLRRGQGDFEHFARLAAPMLDETEFFIRKAIGWVLREVAKKRPELTYGFLAEHLDEVSGLTYREGARALPEALRTKLERSPRPPKPARGGSCRIG